MRRFALLVAALVLTAPLFAACGDSGSPPSPSSPDPQDVRRASEYVREMRPALDRIGAVMLAIDTDGHRRDFRLGLGLLEERKKLDEVLPDGALLLAHNRLEKAVERGATLLIAKPGSPYARIVRRRGLRVGSVGAAAVVAAALADWAGDVERRFVDLGVRVPEWVTDERAVMEPIARDASSRLRDESAPLGRAAGRRR